MCTFLLYMSIYLQIFRPSVSRSGYKRQKSFATYGCCHPCFITYFKNIILARFDHQKNYLNFVFNHLILKLSVFLYLYIYIKSNFEIEFLFHVNFHIIYIIHMYVIPVLLNNRIFNKKFLKAETFWITLIAL